MADPGPKKIRWVLAHGPVELYLRAARKFKATMVRFLFFIYPK